MTKLKPQIPEFHAVDREAWRKWLHANHKIMDSVWLVIYKKGSATSSVNYEEAVEEALCYGWIDSRPQKRDEECFLLAFSKRKPKSVWSASNKKRIERLIAENKMAPAGLATIEIAKENGSWTSIDKVEAMEMPEALSQAFKKNKQAKGYFDAFPPSVKKGIYQWIITAKTDETRNKRVTETVELAAKNIRANQWVPKDKR
jgi:uncharacterized protein YdeI (YjbR/CyaY-like superfamily)